MSEIPKVVTLKPIRPTVESARADTFRYEHLTPAVEKNAPDEYGRQTTFWEAEEGSLEEVQAAEQLALQYMLMTANYLNNQAASSDSKRLWSDRYTQATSEIYGTPESEVARELFADQAGVLLQQANEAGVDPELIEHFSGINRLFGGSHEATEQNEMMFEAAARQVGDYLQSHYQTAYDALNLEDAPERIDSADIVGRFGAALDVLARDQDPTWAEWTVELVDDKDQLSIESGKKRILVGAKRAAVTPAQLKGLFSHEVLLHAQRAINGSKISKELGSGLPGYLDAEEGIGVFFEYAVTGMIPEKNVDRYVDTALALGQIDGVQRSRSELTNFALTRALLRNELLPEAQRQGDEAIKTSVFAHVNRIYRGSLGNEYVGVHTKDIAYHKGFIDMGAYVSRQLEMGKPITEIVEFLLKGKFDPTNGQHLERVA